MFLEGGNIEFKSTWTPCHCQHQNSPADTNNNRLLELHVSYFFYGEESTQAWMCNQCRSIQVALSVRCINWGFQFCTCASWGRCHDMWWRMHWRMPWNCDSSNLVEAILRHRCDAKRGLPLLATWALQHWLKEICRKAQLCQLKSNQEDKRKAYAYLKCRTA